MMERRCIPLPQNFDATTSIPRGDDLVYECTSCGRVIPSIPDDNVGCSCGNVFVDVDTFRVVIDDYSQFKVLRCIDHRSGS